MTRKTGLFPTFFLSGFECSTFHWRGQGRRDLVRETQHDTHTDEDYRLLSELGIATAREAIPWPMVDQAGRCDFSRIDPMIAAMKRYNVLPIWDLCHYGYPDDLDPYGEVFIERFAAYCQAAARYVAERMDGPYFFTPINEITHFASIAGEWGFAAPYGTTRAERNALRLNLCKADIAAVHAIRSAIPGARMVQIDPLIQLVAPRDRPDLVEVAHYETYTDSFLAWDILYGKAYPELGGSPEILDIVGANNYSFSQMEYRERGPHRSLDPGDDRILPLFTLMNLAWERYHRPILIGETSGLRDGRDEWLNDVIEESLAAVNVGMDLHGICLYPAVDMPDWYTGEWLHNGLFDLVELDGDLRRVPYPPYIEMLRHWQRELNCPLAAGADPYTDPVDLQDVINAAARLDPKPDANWY